MSFELIEVGKRLREDDEETQGSSDKIQSISCVVAETTEEERRGLCAEGDPPLGMPTDRESGTVSLKCVAKTYRNEKKDLPKTCWAPTVIKNVLEENIKKDGKYGHDDRKPLGTQPFVVAHDNTEMTFKTESDGNRNDVDALVEELIRIYEDSEPIAQESEEDKIVFDRGMWEEEIDVKISPSVSWTKQPFKKLLKLYYYSRDQGYVYENLEQRFGNDDAAPLTQGENTGLGETYVPSPHDVGSYLLGYVAVDRDKSLHAMHVARTNRKKKLEAELKSLFANAAKDRLAYEETKDLVEKLGHRALDSTVFPNVYVTPFPLPAEGINDQNAKDLIERWRAEKERGNIPPDDHPTHLFKWDISAVLNKVNKMYINQEIIKEKQEIIEQEYYHLPVDPFQLGDDRVIFLQKVVQPHVECMVIKIADGDVRYDAVLGYILKMFNDWGEDVDILEALFGVIGENWKNELKDPQKYPQHFKQMQVVKNILLDLGFTIDTFNEDVGDFLRTVV